MMSLARRGIWFFLGPAEERSADGDADRFDEVGRGMFGKRLTYKQLIGETNGVATSLALS
jgi:hypothetical protein